MRNILRAEWIKMWSIPYAWVCASISAVLSALGTALLSGALRQNYVRGVAPLLEVNTIAPFIVASTVTLGSLFMLVWGVLSVTEDYAHDTVDSTFRALPRRWEPMLAKTFLHVACAVVLAIVNMLLSLFVVWAILPHGSANFHHVLTSASLHIFVKVAIVYSVYTVMGVAVGMVTRKSAIGLGAIFLWKWPVELFFLIMQSKIVPLLPYYNMQVFQGRDFFGAGEAPLTNPHLWWGPTGGLLYFIAVTLVVFCVGLWVVSRGGFSLPRWAYRRGVSETTASTPALSAVAADQSSSREGTDTSPTGM